jgi:benzoylformate decarboxylase
MGNAQTVHDVTYDLLRSLGLKTVFGNPGSTEQTFKAIGYAGHKWM